MLSDLFIKKQKSNSIKAFFYDNFERFEDICSDVGSAYQELNEALDEMEELRN